MRRSLAELWSLLWIDHAKLDEEYRAELHERGVLGLRIVSMLAIALPVLVVLLFWPLEGADYRGEGWYRPGLAEESAGFLLGVAGWVLASTRWGRRHALSSAVVITITLAIVAAADMITSGGHTASVYTALVILVLAAVAVLPLRPISMLAYGLTVTAVFAVSALFDPSVGWPLPTTWLERLFLLIVVSVLGAALSAVMTRLHIREHESREVLAQSLEALQRTQASLISSKRAASQGRLAAAISHEVNNPLSVLLSSSEFIERQLSDLGCKCGDPEAVRRSVADASRAAERSRQALGRIVELVERFERFTQLDAAERRSVDVNSLLDDAIGVLSGAWGEGIRVVRDYGELPEVIGYPAGLSEVFGNVLSNAAGAIDDEGEIRLTTRYGRGYVWIQIADSGRGIDTDDLSTIFDPMFRVENGRVRTGWGLFISRQIIHDHRGDFRISSQPDEGTEVEICLPARAGESPG